MLILVSGNKCSGKSEVANYLMIQDYTLLELARPRTLRAPSIPHSLPGYNFDTTPNGLETSLALMNDRSELSPQVHADDGAERTVSKMSHDTQGQKQKDNNAKKKKKKIQIEEVIQEDALELEQEPEKTTPKKKTIRELMDEVSDDEPHEVDTDNMDNDADDEEEEEEKDNEKEEDAAENLRRESKDVIDQHLHAILKRRPEDLRPTRSITQLIQEMTTSAVEDSANEAPPSASIYGYGPEIGSSSSQPYSLQPPPPAYTAYDSPDGTKYIVFESMDTLVPYVIKNWRDDFVFVLDPSPGAYLQLERLEAIPYVLHVAVEAPTTTRWKRFLKKTYDFSFTPQCSSPGRTSLETHLAETLLSNHVSFHEDITANSIDRKPPASLEKFIAESDAIMYGPTTIEGSKPLATVVSRAKVTIINHTDTINSLHMKLGRLNLKNKERLRPSWDLYFMRLAGLAALRSNCMKRRVGCVIVRDNRVIATGYNGTPRGLPNCNEGGCVRCNGGGMSGSNLDSCLCLHAEENALLESGRDRVGANSVIYCNTAPCLTCSIKIVQSGIKEVVYEQAYSGQNSEGIFKQAGVLIRQYEPPNDGVVY